ncbi:hypothetical protein EDC04DRAFT_3090075 [Pisolithus marmoratus]|nr:hypothetical protein EDC04DRAFT_3090075 [Pisolithus marmoratus]
MPTSAPSLSIVDTRCNYPVRKSIQLKPSRRFLILDQHGVSAGTRVRVAGPLIDDKAHSSQTHCGPGWTPEGILEFSIPTQESEKVQWLFKVERIDVHPAENITFGVRESNHPVIATVFKPVVGSQFCEALKRVLEEQISGIFDLMGGIAFKNIEPFGGIRGHGPWTRSGYGSGHLEREPQILPGEKRGPRTDVVPLGERPELQGIAEGGVGMTEGNKQ